MTPSAAEKAQRALRRASAFIATEPGGIEHDEAREWLDWLDGRIRLAQRQYAEGVAPPPGVGPDR